MNEAVLFLTGLAQAIATMSLYKEGHPARERAIDAAFQALLDLQDPKKEIARLPYPLFSPKHEWEVHGVVDFVVFPTGTALFDDTLYIYYGAADEHIACASLSLSGLVAELLIHKTTHDS